MRLCIAGLDSGALSHPLRHYLANCLQDIVDGAPIERAMCVEAQRARGRPKNPFPNWEMPLAVFAAILKIRHYKPEAINDAMRKVRRIDRSEALRIRKTYAAMAELPEADLIDRCPVRVREILRQFPPQVLGKKQ